MKNFKNVLLIVVLLIGLIQIISAQTNVSGGIYSNTTWYKANSPYIVIDTVVVFPGVTLTIQPGVTVKFTDNKRLEIRQGKLIAQGTETDSIVFTSNSINPVIGSWDKVFLNNTTDTIKINYCNFYYANYGITGNLIKIKNSKFNSNFYGIWADKAFIDSCIFTNNSYRACLIGTGYINSCNLFNNNYGLFVYNDSILINNCKSNFNQFGIYVIGLFNHTKITNCEVNNNQTGIYYESTSLKITNSEISHNQTGITDSSDFIIVFNLSLSIKNSIIDSNSITGLNLFMSYDTVVNCQIKYNGVGIQLAGNGIIKSNQIENNVIGVKSLSNNIIICNKICNNSSYDFYNSSNQSYDISGNYWCTSDSTVVSARIYDGYDNINFGLVTFMPLDTSQCYLITGIKEKEINNISFKFFPNPAYDKLTLILPMNNLQSEIKIYNLLGQLEFISKIENTSTELNILKLTNGIYIIELTIDDKIIRKKFIKQ